MTEKLKQHLIELAETIHPNEINDPDGWRFDDHLSSAAYNEGQTKLARYILRELDIHFKLNLSK